MAAEHQYFYEDEVYRVNKKGYIEFGMVLENSELVSSDENSDDEGIKMKKGHIRVAWHPTGIEEVVSERKVGLADRSLIPGDVVRRLIKGKDTQRGYCRQMEVTACLQVVGSKQIINNVSSRDLIPIEALTPDIAVCLDSWVGGIKFVHSKLHLSLPDNSRCIVTDPSGISGFDLFDEKRDCDFPHRGYHYPGQVLWGPLSVLEEVAEWVPPATSADLKTLKSKNTKIIKVKVENVEIEEVGVHWQCRAYSKEGAGSEKEQPKVNIQGEDIKRLKLLNVFEPCTLQVGDRNVYILKSTDEITTKEEWRREQRRLILNNSDPAKPLTPVKTKRKRTPTSTIIREKDELGKNENESVTENEKRIENHNKGLSDIELNNIENSQEGEEWDSECDSETGSNASSSAASVVSNPNSKKAPSLPIRTLTKVLHKKKLRRARSGARRERRTATPLLPGSRLIVETLSTHSTADVVWQDGSVETGIPSTELYPIHHLDDQEFFPGDFVIENRDSSACMRLYGVVQSVDHAGRTAKVKWFKTYTSADTDSPRPSFLGESEVSVYDLKDHPDFQYRPGTVVIRVANFNGEDELCTAGQVLDNYPEGMVRVWWVEGHVSMCWPQDLYKVGEYDSDEGELWDDNTSDDGSWQTESEDTSAPASQEALEERERAEEKLKPKLAANIEKARVAMSRLEEIFTKNPSLQTTDVMRKLLEVYKDCRYLDKLMGTMFFHESHFQGLLERVRERGRANVAQRVADQVQRLFTQYQPEGGEKDVKNTSESERSDGDTETETGGEEECQLSERCGELLAGSVAWLEDCAQTNAAAAAAASSPDSLYNSHVCTKLCSLLLAQLVQAHAEVIKRFGGSASSITEANNASPTNSPLETTIEHKERGGETCRRELSEEEFAHQTPQSPDDRPLPPLLQGSFTIVDTAPNSHKYKLTIFQPTDTRQFYKRVREEIKLLRGCLPPGISVVAYEDRMDLYSVMIRGPERTPYEDGLFFFDIQLSADYPRTPPHCQYISYCSDRLNPNLYEDGKVCVSLLGTWSGKGTEVWTSLSTLLQLFVSIQGLILVNEPYFNEAGYEKQKGTQQGKENSRMYNEMVVLKLVQSMSKILLNPPSVFKEQVTAHFATHASRLSERLESWLDISEKYNNATPQPQPGSLLQQSQPITPPPGVSLPDFPLIPASKGFCLTLRKSLQYFRSVLQEPSSAPATASSPSPASP